MSKSKILVVAAEKGTFASIAAVLADEYQLIHAENGETGLQLYAQQQPILIIVDLHLPVMNGIEFLQHIGVSAEESYAIIVISDQATGNEFNICYQMGITSFLHKPFNDYELKGLVKQSVSARKNYKELKRHSKQLENLVQHRTVQLSEQVTALEQTQAALSDAMGNLLTVRVAPGVFWLQIPEAGLYILCGCPGEVVKHLMHKGLINTVDKEGVTCETGPNAILLSDILVQNGGFANLAEFPVLQMLYRQGMIVPGHPNNTGVKPILIGCAAQVQAQMEYIHRGNYGLTSKEELLACGVDDVTATNMMKVKLKFAFGSIRPPSQLLDTLEVGDNESLPIRNGVTVSHVGLNRYQFSFKGCSTEINLNLPSNVLYQPAYLLGNHRFKRQYFAVLHRGDGDGWDANRPSMGSVIMFQGRIYLVDAAPGVFYNMMALGIDISEVEGIFHTHGHDDHFAGMPALIHSDHRLKYFATPPVRAAVAKKFTALMSMKEEKFGQFFEICDLTFDTWNNCDGLEVMPLYSPHPTEANVLMFRALDGDGYKSYAHWADLSSFKVLDGMVGEGPNDVPADFIAKVKQDYKRPANLKKLDIGGGMIHGLAEDFRDDTSDRLMLAHIDRKLSIEEMEIGSEAAFGALDILIQGEQDYLYQKAFHYLQTFFREVDPGQIYMLLNSPVIDYNVGTILHRAGESLEHVDMILAGTVAYLESKSNIRNHLSFGSLIGINIFFGRRTVLEGTYRAFSHCSVIRFPAPLFRAFLKNNNILTQIETILDKMWFLRKTRLFGEQTMFSSLGTTARDMEQINIPAGEEIPATSKPGLWLVLEGTVTMYDATNTVLEVINSGGFFGEHNYFSDTDYSWTFTAECAVNLYKLHFENILEIPIVHWKMLETFERRKRASSTAKNQT